jgi:hypothetical protein
MLGNGSGAVPGPALESVSGTGCAANIAEKLSIIFRAMPASKRPV